MKALDKKQVARRDAIAASIQMAAGRLRDAIELFDAEVESMFASRVSAEVETYNALLEQAEELRDEVHSEAEAYADDRSEKWVDSDAGQQHSVWRDEWSSEIGPVDIEPPQPTDMPDLDEGDNFAVLPVAMDEV